MVNFESKTHSEMRVWVVISAPQLIDTVERKVGLPGGMQRIYTFKIK